MYIFYVLRYDFFVVVYIDSIEFIDQLIHLRNIFPTNDGPNNGMVIFFDFRI